MGALPVRAILLDWGGTLAPEGGEAEGKGIVEEALAALHARYVVAVATNAPKDAVGEALRKLGLARHVDHLFSADALGAAKPDPGFFRGALRSLGLPPGEAVMVGDRYEADIVGAKGAGLRAVWFNPGEVPCPLAHPVHDGEVRSLEEVPPLLERPFLPDLGEALALLREHGVPENVVRHSLTVAAVAHWIALRLRERGVPVDPLLVHRGALLHDLDKLSSERPEDHGARAGRILRDLGWPDLAGIAERHVLGAEPGSWEEKLVHYADKIVEEDGVVGLEARVTGLSCRYSAEGEKIARALPGLLALEEEILGALGSSRDGLGAELREIGSTLPPFVSLPGAT